MSTNLGVLVVNAAKKIKPILTLFNPSGKKSNQNQAESNQFFGCHPSSLRPRAPRHSQSSLLALFSGGPGASRRQMALPSRLCPWKDTKSRLWYPAVPIASVPAKGITSLDQAKKP
jgi:hypothetical protein